MQRSPLCEVCPVCLTLAAPQEVMSANTIRNAYWVEFGFSPPQLNDVREFQLFLCPACELQFFSPAITGDSVFYNWIAEKGHYAPWRWEFGPIIKLAREVGGTVVEVGAGGGTLTRALVGAGVRLMAIEPSSSARAGLSHIGEAKTYASIDEIEREGIQGDLVVSCHVLEHVEDPVGFLASLVHVTRKGGHIAISVPQYRSLMCSADKIEAFDCPPHHVTRWTGRSLSIALRRAGADQVKLVWEPLSRANAARLLSEKLTGKDRRWLRGLLNKTGIGRELVRVTHVRDNESWRGRNLIAIGQVLR